MMRCKAFLLLFVAVALVLSVSPAFARPNTIALTVKQDHKPVTNLLIVIYGPNDLAEDMNLWMGYTGHNGRVRFSNPGFFPYNTYSVYATNLNGDHILFLGNFTISEDWSATATLTL